MFKNKKMNKEINKMLSGISSVEELSKKNKVTFREKISDWYLRSQAVDCQNIELMWFFIFITATISSHLGFIFRIIIACSSVIYFNHCIEARDIMTKSKIVITNDRKLRSMKILMYGMITILFLAFVLFIIQSK